MSRNCANKTRGFTEYLRITEANDSGGRKVSKNQNTCVIKLSLLACFFLDLAQDVKKGGLHAMAVQRVLPKGKEMCDYKTMNYHKP